MKELSLDKTFLAIVAVYGLVKIIVFNNMASIVTDEIQYKEMIFNINPPHLFNPLYTRFYQIIGIFGDEWYLAARILNLTFLLLGLTAIIAICKKRKIQKFAKILIYASAVLTGCSTYALNLMPETMYIALFYWCMYVFTIKKSIHTKTILLATLNGFLALIKPHAIVFMPAFMLALSIDYIQSRDFYKIPKQLASYIVIFCLIRWGLGYLLEGQLSLGIFGGTYETMGKNVIDTDIPSIFYVINRHLLAWLIMLPMLIPIVIKNIIQHKSSRKYSQFTCAVLGSVICSIIVFSLFTVIVDNGVNLQIHRIHLRYYSFLLPLIFIVIYELGITAYQGSLYRKRPLLSATGISLIFMVYISAINESSYPLTGDWIESPTINYIYDQTSLLVFCFFTLTLSLLIFKNTKYLNLSLLVSLSFLVISEFSQNIKSMRAMAASKDSIKSFTAVKALTANSDFDIHLNNVENGSGTRLDMLQCIKMVFIQIDDSFRNICRKKGGRVSAKYDVYLSEIGLNEREIPSCFVSAINNNNKQIFLYRRKERPSTKPTSFINTEFIQADGFYQSEVWGFWARRNYAELILNKDYNEDVDIVFNARSVGNGELSYSLSQRQKHSRFLNDQWQKVVVSLKKNSCNNVLRFDYNGDIKQVNGRLLGFAIKDLRVQAK